MRSATSKAGTGSTHVKVGVIGTGIMGELHARNLHGRLKGAELVAVADLDLTRAQALAAELGGATAYSDGHELIEDPQVDAVVVSSPNPTHAAYVLACLQADKPVMCEKPLATTPADATQVIEAEARGGRRRVQVGFMREFDPAHAAVRAAVRAGRVGQPVMFRAIHVNRSVGERRMSPNEVITDSIIHDIHSARFLMQREISTVYVTTLPAEPGNVETCRLLTVSCRFDNGALGLMDVNIEAGYGYAVSAEVVGTEGTATTGDPHRLTVRSQLERHQDITANFRERFEYAYLAELDAWLSSVRTGDALGPSSWDGYASLAVADACRESVASGQPVSVKLSDRLDLYL
jgi:myo-inositol 2-dehydrogenase/D-chiro-inositol 1-dehydrogenase